MNKLKIMQSDFAIDPRADDNLGTMACKHSRYDLGDEQIDDPIEWLEDMLELQNKYEYTNERLKYLESLFMKKFVALPLYLYDHSGITISTTPFGDRFDSGQLGYVYVSKEILRKEYSCKRITSKVRKKALAVLKNEVKVYDYYIRSDMYDFMIMNEAGECVDSCSGFYGTDWDTNGLQEYIPEELWPQLDNIEIEY